MTARRATEAKALGRHRSLAQVGLYLFEAVALGLGEEGADEQEGEHGDDGVAEEGDAGSGGGEEDGKGLGDGELQHRTLPNPRVLFSARLTEGAPDLEHSLAQRAYGT